MQKDERVTVVSSLVTVMDGATVNGNCTVLFHACRVRYKSATKLLYFYDMKTCRNKKYSAKNC